MLKTMKVLLLAGVLGGLAASPTLAQSQDGGGGGRSMGGGGHSMGGGGGGGAIYPRMGGGGGHSFGGSGRSFGGSSGVYMRRGGDFSRGDFSRQGFSRQGFESRRMRALAQPDGGDFPRERFRRGDRPDRFVRDNDFRRGDRNRFDRRHGRFDDDGRRHKRFRHRTGAFIFFNNGWWYDEPWWTYDTAYVGAGYGDAHVQWCINHYRSYNPADNTFVSYGGDVRECVSPYGP